MKLLTKEIEQLLIENFNQQEDMGGEGDGHYPIVKYFGGGACTWLITEYDKENELFFGLADLGLGLPELGWISKKDLFEIKFPPFNLPIERDLFFKADKKIGDYAKEAKKNQRIVA